MGLKNCPVGAIINLYSKTTRDNISQSERNELKRVVKQLIDIYRGELL